VPLLLLLVLCSGEQIPPYKDVARRPPYILSDLPLDFAAMASGSGATAQVTHTFFNISWTGFTYRFTGHLLSLANPIDHWSVLPPTGGCGHRVTTTDTAAANGCQWATNGGFFDMDTGECIGNLISNGQAIQLPAPQNSNFGVLKNNSFIIGYLSSAQISQISSETGILQLFTGVTWLVRDGVSFVDQAVAIENPGSGFVTEAAPRVAVGYDKAGHLLVLEVDGEEDINQGPDLYTFADMAISMGFYSGINIDGGGSATVVYNGTLCSSCGIYDTTCNQAQPQGWVGDDPCQRAVTTITCFK